MASPAAISDDLSTFGKSSLRPQLDLQPQLVPEDSDSDVDRPVADLLAAAFDGDIPRARKSAKKLAKAGKGVDEAVESVGDPESKRHGPLHMGAAAGKVICKFLIKDFQANVDATDAEGATPLVFAVQGTGSTAIVSLLLSHGADANKADNDGIAPLHVAADRGFYEVPELLLSEDADVDPICENGGAPVHIAAKNGHVEVLKVTDFPVLSIHHWWRLSGSSVECLEVLIENGKMPVEIAALKRWLQPLEIELSDSTLYAKRSLCFQHLNDKESALADAKAYRDLQPVVPEPCSDSEEEGDALKLVEEYSRGIEALMFGLNLGPESGPADKGSSTKAAAVAAAGPPVRRSTRERKPNSFFSGPEWGL
ncbi:hypothetical protein BAE44_0006939 [Dichanthelium oligosanthes]|uniref:Uncharacterized protein n=1 Tax=Dichanthelium oligosanthes TaxID=888268 RepID=A0A1E5W3P9_9POAL|nr:hypothetical protein BAE44_0006939 [Dichanthelium oligosanthes]